MIQILYHIKKFLLDYFFAEETDEYLEKLITKYYELFPKKNKGIRNRHARRKIIISLTTIPDRIDKVWITVESLLRQTYKPDQIILWLAQDEFEGIELPDKLKQQMKRGLAIRYCDNLRSYKKFYYTAVENPQAYIVTVDDDIIYAEGMLEKLLKAYKKNPGSIICTRSHWITMRNGRVLPYDNWVNFNKRKKIPEYPAYGNFFTSGGGTLLPIFMMDKRLFEKDIFMEIAPTADDVWLNFCAWVSGLKIKNVDGILGHVILIKSSSKKGLSLVNLKKNNNDEQIKKVIEYLNINIRNYIG